MKKAFLVIHVPVLHRGYLDFFERISREVSAICILGPGLVRAFRIFKDDISSLPAKEASRVIHALGYFHDVGVIEESDISEIRRHPVILVGDEISRRLAEKLLDGVPLRWESVFLRWDAGHVARATAVNFEAQSHASVDQSFLREAYREAEKSSDWWRRVGALLVKDGRMVVRSYNRDIPDEASYRFGNIRDHLKVGERPDLSNTIHAEARAIAEAAKDGIATAGTDLYVTHFPCSMCAKSIVAAGIAKCYFGEGSANFDAEQVLKAAQVRIVHVQL